MQTVAADFDGAWKTALDHYFAPFLAFFFPVIHAAIDWSQPVTVRDPDLQQLAPVDQRGKQRVDKLVQVVRRDSTPAWVLVHLEIQSQRDPAFPERMLFYHVRLMDRERLPVVSLAVLGDDQPAWRPDQLTRHLWGCELTFRFPTVKLLDYDPAVLATLTNPFATVTLLHRDAQETRGDPEERLRRKVVRYRALLRQGYRAADIRLLLRLMEHLLRLQPELARQARDAMRQVEQEELGMETFVTSFEEIGQRDLVLRQLTRKVGPLSTTVQAQVDALSGAALLDLSDALLDFTQADDLTTWLAQHQAAAADDAAGCA